MRTCAPCLLMLWSICCRAHCVLTPTWQHTCWPPPSSSSSSPPPSSSSSSLFLFLFLFLSTLSYDIRLDVKIHHETVNVFVTVRPGVQELFRRLSPHYEIVVYTASLAKYVGEDDGGGDAGDMCVRVLPCRRAVVNTNDNNNVNACCEYANDSCSLRRNAPRLRTKTHVRASKAACCRLACVRACVRACVVLCF